MKRTVLIYALVLLMALMAVIAVAQCRLGTGPAGQPAGCAVRCQTALGLSQNQVAEMTKLRTAFANDTADLMKALQAKMKEAADLWLVADPDLQTIKQKAAEADQIRAEIRDKAIDTRGACMKILTPDQRTKCAKLCQSGQCGCGMCGMGCGPGMGMGACGMGPGAGLGAGQQGMGAGQGRGMCGGRGPAGAGCPLK